MMEVKARLYDIAERLKELEIERQSLVKEIKEKALALNLESFLSTTKGKAEELKAKTEKLIKNLEEAESLTKEATELKNKLEVLK